MSLNNNCSFSYLSFRSSFLIQSTFSLKSLLCTSLVINICVPLSGDGQKNRFPSSDFGPCSFVLQCQNESKLEFSAKKDNYQDLLNLRKLLREKNELRLFPKRPPREYKECSVNNWQMPLNSVSTNCISPRQSSAKHSNVSYFVWWTVRQSTWLYNHNNRCQNKISRFVWTFTWYTAPVSLTEWTYWILTASNNLPCFGNMLLPAESWRVTPDEGLWLLLVFTHTDTYTQEHGTYTHTNQRTHNPHTHIHAALSGRRLSGYFLFHGLVTGGEF